MKINNIKKLGAIKLKHNSLMKIIGGNSDDVCTSDDECTEEVRSFKQGNDKVVRKKPGRTTY